MARPPCRVNHHHTGFTFVTHGNHKKDLKGPAALEMFPHIQDVVGRFKGKDKKVTALAATHCDARVCIAPPPV